MPYKFCIKSSKNTNIQQSNAAGRRYGILNDMITPKPIAHKAQKKDCRKLLKT